MSTHFGSKFRIETHRMRRGKSEVEPSQWEQKGQETSSAPWWSRVKPEGGFMMQFSGRGGEKQQGSGFFQIRSCISKIPWYFVIRYLTAPCSGGIHVAGDAPTALSAPLWEQVPALVQKNHLWHIRADEMGYDKREQTFLCCLHTENNPEKHSGLRDPWCCGHMENRTLQGLGGFLGGTCWGCHVNGFYECSSWKTCFIFLLPWFMDFFFPWEICAMLQRAAQ